MMLHPSYKELMQITNENSETGEPILKSRYSVVMGASKRARQIVAADNKLIEEGVVSASDPRPKALSRAIKELDNGDVAILAESCEGYESYVSDENGRF